MAVLVLPQRGYCVGITAVFWEISPEEKCEKSLEFSMFFDVIEIMVLFCYVLIGFTQNTGKLMLVHSMGTTPLPPLV